MTTFRYMGGLPRGWHGWQSGPVSFSVSVANSIVVAGDIEDALRESIRRLEPVLQEMREELAIEIEAKGQRDQALKRHRQRELKRHRQREKREAKAKGKRR